MKWKPADLQNAINGKGALPPFVLVYGDDAGVVRQLVKKALEASPTPLDDPFMSDRLDIEDLTQEPGRLLDAASTMGFGGGVRLIQVKGLNGELPKPQIQAATEAVKYVLEAPLNDVLIIMSAPLMDAKSALVSAVEKHKQAVAVRCFQDTSRDIGQVVRQFFQAEGKSVDGAAVQFLTENLGNDREVTLRELEVLSLYAGQDATITLEHCLEAVSSAPSLSIFKLCDAIGSRDPKAVQAHLNHMMEEGEDLFRVSAMVQRHLRRLLVVQDAMAQGAGSEQAMKGLKPPVFFGKNEFMAQANRYPRGRLQKLHQQLYKLQKESRQAIVSPDLVYARGLLAMAL